MHFEVRLISSRTERQDPRTFNWLLEQFVDRLLWIMATADLKAVPFFADYASYLTANSAHCLFVERHFTQTNRAAAPGSTGFHCKPNSIREMFSIFHQL